MTIRAASDRHLSKDTKVTPEIVPVARCRSVCEGKDTKVTRPEKRGTSSSLSTLPLRQPRDSGVFVARLSPEFLFARLSLPLGVFVRSPVAAARSLPLARVLTAL